VVEVPSFTISYWWSLEPSLYL